jgi:hypothetical protein
MHKHAASNVAGTAPAFSDFGLTAHSRLQISVVTVTVTVMTGITRE